MRNANDTVAWLYSDAAVLCQRFGAFDRQIQALSDDDPHRSDLQHDLESLRARILKRFGVLGKHFPNLDPNLGSAIFVDPITSSEYRRKYLTSEDVFVALLEGSGGEATIQDLWAFMSFLDIHELAVDAEGLDAIVAANPGRLEMSQDGKNHYRLKPVDRSGASRRRPALPG
jgi:hypothetical protein